MVSLQENECCGCTACVSVCPQKCLSMVENAEGFLVPCLIDTVKCIDCNLCNKVCPVLNKHEDKKHFEKGYIVQNTNEKTRIESTSGGAFSAIALSVLDEGGIVYGAAYVDNFTVRHIGVEKASDLWKLRNSKYIQSNLDHTFSEVKKRLESGRKVCFSGTPCQIEGLIAFLRKDYDNLILVDVVCHGIGSPLIWRKYMEMQSAYQPEYIFFRWKHYGYKYSTMSFFKNSKEIYFSGVESDPMLRAYFTNSCDRNSCYDCPFKKRYRLSDYTIWDCFQPKYFDASFNDDKGTSSVLINSEKGMMQFEKILASGTIRYHEVVPDELTFGNNEMIHSVKKGTVRDVLLADASVMDGKELFEKYYPNTIKSKVKKQIRKSLLTLGIYNRVKYVLYVYRRNKSKHDNAQS